MYVLVTIHSLQQYNTIMNCELPTIHHLQHIPTTLDHECSDLLHSTIALFCVLAVSVLEVLRALVEPLGEAGYKPMPATYCTCRPTYTQYTLVLVQQLSYTYN